jgi:polyhydroxyalkanoate synthesis regulator phasin
MFENLKKQIDKGIELASATEAKIEKAAKEFAAENNLNKEEAKKLLDQWLKKSEEAKKAIEKQLVDLQKTVLAKMNLVTKQDVKKLEERIKKLELLHKKPGNVSLAKAPARKPARKAVPVKK